MSQRSTGPAGPPAGGEWPDDLWPADDEVPGQQGNPAAGSRTLADGTHADGTPPLPRGWPGADGPPRTRWLRPGVLATVIISGAVAGAVVAAAVLHDFSSPAASGQPPALSQQQPGGNGAPAGGTLPGGTLPGGAQGGPGSGMFVIGTVTAVGGSSITIGGLGHTITATVTGATRVSGKVAGLGGIKVGDQVSAQLTQDGGRIIAVAIADPAQAPAGVTLP